MTAKETYQSVTGCTGLISISVNSSHANAVSVAIVKTESSTLSMGDSVDIEVGYQGGGATQIFTGYVKSIEREYPDGVYIITAHDVLVRAVDYFIATKNPENPIKFSKVSGESMVRQLLQLAGITNFGYEATNFIYGYTNPAEINLIGCYDICKQITDMLAWHLYADASGKVWFVDRKPYPVGGDTPVKTVTHPSILNMNYSISDDDLRNRVVVYGANGVYAESKASSPYLPAGYYKTAVLSTWIIDKYQYAKSAADYNLATWNRLRKSLNITIEGDEDIQARDVITITDAIYLGINSNWYVYACEHKIDKSGYTLSMELRQ